MARRKLDPDEGRIELLQNASVLALMVKTPRRIDEPFLVGQVGTAYRIAYEDGVRDAEKRERQEKYAREDRRRKARRK